MAQLDPLGLSVPAASTITLSLAVIPITRNSTTLNQEIMSIASPNSTGALAIAEVQATAPASTTYGMVVRIADPIISSVAGIVSVNFQSTAAVVVSSVAGAVMVRSSAADHLTTVYQSTAADMQVTVTPAAGSTFRTQPGSTLWASSAGFHFDSSGAMQVNVVAGSAASTIVTVARVVGNSSAADYLGARLVDSSGTGFHGPTNPLPIAVTDSSNAVVKAGDSANNAIRVNIVTGGGSGGTAMADQTTFSTNVTSFTPIGAAVISGASDVPAGEAGAVRMSSIRAIWVHTVDSTGGITAAGSTVVTISRIVGNSSAADSVPVRIVLADGSTFVQPAIDYTHSGAVSASTVTGPAVLLYASSAAPSSVTDGDMVLQWGTQRGAANVALVTSSGAGIDDSTNAAIRVNVVAGSVAGTVYVHSAAVTASTVQGPANMLFASSAAPSSVTDADMVLQWGTQRGAAVVAHYTSSGADMSDSTNASLRVTVSSLVGPVTVRVNTSSGGAVEGSTTAPAVGVTGLHVRQVFPTMNSTTILITSTHSTAVYELISSVAALRHKVYAYFVGSTHANPSTLVFMSSLAAGDHWHVNFGSGSSGITGANLALTPPGFLFQTIAANALNVRVEGGSSVTSTVIVRISLAWFDEA